MAGPGKSQKRPDLKELVAQGRSPDKQGRGTCAGHDGSGEESARAPVLPGGEGCGCSGEDPSQKEVQWNLEGGAVILQQTEEGGK